MDPQTLILIPLLLICGAAAGVLAGLLGVGGGIVIVPMLYHVFTGLGLAPALAMPLSVGTSLSTIVLTSIVSARGHHRRGTVDWPLIRRWLPWVVLGVVVGTALGGTVDGVLLKRVFGALLTVVAVHMLITSVRRPLLADRLPGPLGQRGLAAFIGGFSAMLGIGGGTLTVPILNLYAYPIHRAVGTASVFGFIISVPATVGYLLAGRGVDGLPAGSTGYVNWLAFAILVPATMLFAPLGVRLCHGLDVTRLKQAFAVFLGLVGLKMVFW